ncbi:hypothetical protein CHLRE_02g083450v5 [Chlamydomonas reinhardtii]|uniref:FAD-binding domain-containing protein n=1 Tax=Chlamydomonas reinhardtii TaxID=3055 RepID=A0A2K3E0N0_CHLRE|nr:uncharacterized protein CHLRE_02g083450v5 [Chlamydomonas reinhardtii]PNW86360.1 hypothetical protein CHLRE_02g083450v5 [Chlamydomonas reinhardtii]
MRGSLVLRAAAAEGPAASSAQPASLDEVLDVAVVGGGPCGLACALALLQVLPAGTKLKVLEASPAYTQQGAGVLLNINGARALEAIHPSLMPSLAARSELLAGMFTYNDVTGDRMPWSRGVDHAAALTAGSSSSSGKQQQQTQTQQAAAAAGGAGVATAGSSAASDGGGSSSSSGTGGWYSPGLIEWNEIRAALYGSLPPGVVEFGCKAVSCAAPAEAATATAATAAATSTAAGGAVTATAAEGAATAAAGATADEQQQQQLYELDVVRTGPGPQRGQRVVVRARHVIAADGYFSRVRRTAGDGRTPVFRERLTWRGSVARSDLLGAAGGRAPRPVWLDPEQDPQGAVSSHVWTPMGPEGRPPPGPPETLVLVYPAGASGRLVFAAFAPLSRLLAAGEQWPAPAEAGEEKGAGKAEAEGGEAGDGPVSVHLGGSSTGAAGPTALRRLLATFRHLPPDLLQLLAAAPPHTVTEHGISFHDVEGFVQGAWARGRLLAVGDAAHSGPTDGQGANLAMEDAAVLGACVRKHGLGPEAFAAWEAARQPRVAAILGDRTPNAAVRTPLIQQAAFERLWSAEQVAAAAAAAAGAAAGAGAEGAEGAGSEGGVPLEVAAQVAAAAAAGGEAAAAEVLTEWSREAVRTTLLGKLAARPAFTPQPVQQAPAGSWSFR